MVYQIYTKNLQTVSGKTDDVLRLSHLTTFWSVLYTLSFTGVFFGLYQLL